MKLVYCKMDPGNFGDDLNAWLWAELLPPGFFDDNPQELFYGIGTLLSHRLPQTPHKIIFGAGTGYKPPPVLDDTYSVYFVRGPLTAQRLGLPPTRAITDPAYLVLNTASAREPVDRTQAVALIPHHQTMATVDWPLITGRTGIPIIDPRGPCQDVIRRIRATRLVITESLHGAILADAFRVPWIPIRLSYRFLDFKWTDWAQSVDLDFTPCDLPPIFHGPLPAQQRALNCLRHRLASAGLGPTRWTRRPYRNSSLAETERFTTALEELAKTGRPLLSTDPTVQRLRAQLTAQVERLVQQPIKR